MVPHYHHRPEEAAVGYARSEVVQLEVRQVEGEAMDGKETLRDAAHAGMRARECPVEGGLETLGVVHGRVMAEETG